MVESDGRLPRFQASSTSTSPNGRQTIASRANALEVYEDAVQEPMLECNNLASMYYGAQEIGSRRPEAKVLREDFCSSAIVAQTWLGLEKGNRSQGVDIDLDALQVAQRRISKSKKKVRLVQSAQYSSTGKLRVLEMEEKEAGEGVSLTIDEDGIAEDTKSPDTSSTWSEGAASDRFERRFQARLAKDKLAKDKLRGAGKNNGAEEGDVVTLLHADVLSLPLADVQIESPDLVYAGNYALSYFHDRRSLLAYLAQCKRTLRPETGVLIVDPFAGPTNWEPCNNEEREEQLKFWAKFSKEPGFLRNETSDPPLPLERSDLQFWKTAQTSTSGSDWQGWPRGRLILVRKGHLCGGYEYWREDGPIDYVTNQFRMSLSFRFKDGSWLRDYFSYDFRVWSLREIVEAMEEVGFKKVQVHAIPRHIGEKLEEDSSDSEDSVSDEGDDERRQGDEDSQGGLGGMATLMQRTEKQESEKINYRHLIEGEKLFAGKSFGSESANSLLTTVQLTT